MNPAAIRNEAGFYRLVARVLDAMAKGYTNHAQIGGILNREVPPGREVPVAKLREAYEFACQIVDDQQVAS